LAIFDGNAYFLETTILADGIIGVSGVICQGCGISAGVENTVKILIINSMIDSFNQNINSDD